MWQVAIEAAIILGDFIYHRWFDQPPKPVPARSIAIPRVDAGAPYALLYGQARCKAPIIAWTSTPVAVFAADDPDNVTGRYSSGVAIDYMMDMLFTLGIGFRDGTNKLLNMFSGDVTFIQNMSVEVGSSQRLADLTGNGGFEDATKRAWVNTPVSQGTASWGTVEFLNGNASQQLVDPATFAGTTEAGYYMSRDNYHTGSAGTAPWGKYNGNVDPSLIPGYRGLISVFLYNRFFIVGDTDNPYVRHWVVGDSPNVPAYSFELSTYPNTFLGPSAAVDAGRGAIEANPIDVLYDLLTAPYGKLGLDPSRIGAAGLATFQAAARTLAAEGHGFSRSWEGGQTASELIHEILRQIDATLYEDPLDGCIKIKLIRNDYDPSTLQVISPANCEAIQNFAAGGWTGTPNKMRVTFTNRDDGYRDGSATAQSMANAVGQSGETREVQLQMPGVCTQQLADAISGRELAAQCRPFIKCRAVVDRSFRNAVPGDVVKLLWPEYGVSNVVMRVANVNRGTQASAKITLDLIQDYYYVWRNQPPVNPTMPPLKTPGSSSLP